MDAFNFDVFAGSNKIHQTILDQVREAPIFWKKIVETYTEAHFPDINTNRWREIYMLLKGPKPPYNC